MGAFTDILDQVDQSQNVAINCLSQRQTEMFQLAQKYRQPSGFKNDAIGVWYEAKNSVTSAITKLRNFIQEKSDSVMAQAVKPNYADNSTIGKVDYMEMIEKFEQDMVNLRKNTQDYNKSITKIQTALK